MPHGPQNTESLYYGGWTALTQDGRYQYNNYMTSSYGRTIRPASTNNKFVGVRRPPSPWETKLARWHVTDGEVLRTYPSSFWSYSRGYLCNVTQTQLRDMAVDALLNPELESNLIRESLASILESETSLGEALVQARSTCKSVHRLATGLAHGTEAFMLRRFPRGPKELKNLIKRNYSSVIRSLPGDYLEYLYGWKPLADDVTNAFEQLDRQFQRDRNAIRFELRKKRTLKGKYTLTSSMVDYWAANPDWAQVMDVVQTSRISLDFRFPDRYRDDLPSVAPFGTAWNSAPWSFVIDWFIPIGGWISAWETMQYAAWFAGGSSSTWCKVRSREDQKPTLKGLYHNDIVSLKIPSANGYSLHFRRQVYGAEDLVNIIKFPSFNNTLGLSKASQSIALLTQVLQKWFTGGRLD